jgi:general secretion pathway protein H
MAVRAQSTAARPAGGFTLLEMLVVLVVIGVALAVATPSTGLLEQSRQDEAVEQLRLALEQAVFESVLGGQELLFVAAPAAYHFERRDDEGGWLQARADGPLRPRELPDGLRIESVWLDEAALARPARLPFAGAAPPLFRVVLRRGARTLQLRSTAGGAVRLLPSDEVAHAQ